MTATAGILIAIVGPTASGKTELSVRLAERFDGEIISADSRQVFRGMDVGTAKPAPAERRRVPHHLFDVASPDEPLGLARYLDLAHEALGEVWSRGRLPFLVGGTGQYVWALLEGWQVPRIPPQLALRDELERRAALEGLPALAAELEAVDPIAAGRIDLKNIRRVVRALEVAALRGPSQADAVRRDPPPWNTLLFALDLPRPALYERIDARVDAMLRGGFIDEVRRLREAGYGNAFAMTGIGYREVSAYLDGAMSLEMVAEKMKAATHRLARTQSGWFRRADPRIRWLNPERAFEDASVQIEAMLPTSGGTGC